jgi:hypothetical protein
MIPAAALTQLLGGKAIMTVCLGGSAAVCVAGGGAADTATPPPCLIPLCFMG